MDNKFKYLFISLLITFLIISSLLLWNFSLVKLYFYKPSSFDIPKKNFHKLKTNPKYQSPVNQNKAYNVQIYGKNQKLITDKIFDFVSSFSDDKMLVAKDGLYGIIDLKGNYILKLRYDSISRSVLNFNGKEQKSYILASKTESVDKINRKIKKDYIFDMNGKQLYSADKIDRDNLFFLVYNEKSNTWNILDFFDFKKVLDIDFVNKPEIIYGKTKDSDNILGKYLIVRNRNQNVFVLDFSGNEVVPSGYYSNITYEYNIAGDKDYFKVTHKGKTGIITSDNKIIVPIIFNRVERKHNIKGEETFWGIKYCTKHEDSPKKNLKNRKSSYYSASRKNHRKNRVDKYANFDFNGNFIEKANINDIVENNIFPYISNRNQVRVIKSENFPVRKIVPIITKKSNFLQEENKLMTLKELNDYIAENNNNFSQTETNTQNIIQPLKTSKELNGSIEENNKSFNQTETTSQFNIIQPPKPQKKHTTVYSSDFGKSKINGGFTHLTCLAKPYFCKLSPNGLSAKYCGKESVYIANTKRAYGKYYCEVYIENPEKQEISRNTIFSLIHFPLYKTENDAETYKTSWNSANVNRYDLEFSRYNFKNKDIAGIAIDLDNGRMYLQINGEWLNNPYDKSDGIKLQTEKSYYPAFSVAGYKEILTVNFGRQPFKYNMPEGYTTLNYKDEIKLPKSEQSNEKQYSFLDIE